MSVGASSVSLQMAVQSRPEEVLAGMQHSGRLCGPLVDAVVDDDHHALVAGEEARHQLLLVGHVVTRHQVLDELLVRLVVLAVRRVLEPLHHLLRVLAHRHRVQVEDEWRPPRRA